MEAVEPIETPARPRLKATKARAERQRPLTTRPPVADAEPDIDDVDDFDAPPAPPPRPAQTGRPRIAASSAKEAAERPRPRPRPVAARTPRKARRVSSG